MELFIVRHGIAEEPKWGQDDAQRALTPAGEERLHRTLTVAREAGVAPSLILTSPYRRALQTAAIAAKLLHCREIITTDLLVPHGTPVEVWDELRLYKDEAAVLLSSHEPLCGRLMGYLLGCPQLPVDVKKGSVMGIAIDRFGPVPFGVLKFYLTPKLARGA